MKKYTIDRRGFLRVAGAAAAGFPYVVRSSALGKEGSVPASERITMGCIGVGGRGSSNMRAFLGRKQVQILAVCDVDKNHRDRAKKTVDDKYGNSDCKAYLDFREVIVREDIDALSLALPDHWHSIPAIMGARYGKDMYAEKPLARTIREGRAMVEAVERYGRVWQTGSQQRSTANFHKACELVRNGRIGKVSRVEVGLPTGRPGGNPPVQPPPPGLDWDFWLGPAPERPYHPAYHPWRWRDWRDFGTGPLGDMGCHILSTVFKALKLRYPISIEAICREIGPEVHPREFKVHYEFPARGGLPPVRVTWYDSGFDSPRPKDLEPGRRLSSPIYIGERGTLMDHMLIPESKRKAYGMPPKVLSRSPGQYQEWIDACRGGSPADRGSDRRRSRLCGRDDRKANIRRDLFARHGPCRGRAGRVRRGLGLV